MLTEGTKKLRAFLDDHGVLPSRAARELDVSLPSFLEWVAGNHRPKPIYRQAIERWTKGAIKEDDWLSATERTAIKSVEPFKPAAAGE